MFNSDNKYFDTVDALPAQLWAQVYQTVMRVHRQSDLIDAMNTHRIACVLYCIGGLLHSVNCSRFDARRRKHNHSFNHESFLCIVMLGTGIRRLHYLFHERQGETGIALEA